MSNPTPMNLQRAVVVLRRWWWIPLLAALVGGVLAFVAVGGGGTTTVDSKVSIVQDPSLPLILSGITPDGSGVTVGRRARALAAEIADEQLRDDLGAGGADVTVSVSVLDDDNFSFVVTAPTRKQATEVTGLLIAHVEDARKSDLALAATATRAAVASARTVLEDYLADDSAGRVEAGGVVILDRADAVSKLAEYQLLDTFADGLESFGDGVSASSTVSSSSSRTAAGALSAIVFLALGITGTLAIGGRSRRIGDLDDALAIVGTAPLLATLVPGGGAVGLALSVRHSVPGDTGVGLVTVGATALAGLATDLEQELRRGGDERTVIAPAPLPAGLAELREHGCAAVMVVRVGSDDAQALELAQRAIDAAGIALAGWCIDDLGRR